RGELSSPGIAFGAHPSRARHPRRSARNGRLALAVDDEPAGRVVGRDCHGHAVAEHDANTMAPHLPGELRENLVAVVEPDAKVSSLRNQDDFAVEMYKLFLAHEFLWTSPRKRCGTGPLVST